MKDIIQEIISAVTDNINDSGYYFEEKDAIKKIKSLLKTRDKELREKIEGMKKKDATPWEDCTDHREFIECGHNQALDKVLSLLDGEEK